MKNSESKPTNQDTPQSPYDCFNNYSTFQTQNPQNPPQGIPILVPILYDPQHDAVQIEQLIKTAPYSTGIKNLPFSEQKWEFIKILSLIALSSILEYFFIILLLIFLYLVVDMIAMALFPISLMILVPVAKFSTDKVKNTIFQKTNSIVAYILLAELTAQTLLFFSRSLPHTRPPHQDGFYFTTADIVLIGILYQIGVNCFVTSCTLVYLLLENKKIQYLPVLIFLSFCTMISMINFFPFLISGLFGMLYAILLINSLKQIQNGRFKLEKGNLFLNVNSVTFAILIPCNNNE